MKNHFHFISVLCFFLIFVIVSILTYNQLFRSDYVMNFEYDHDDVYEINSFYVRKADQEIAIVDRKNNEVRIGYKETQNLGGLKIQFKSRMHGTIEYTDHPINPGRVLTVTCSDGKIVIAVYSAGYL